MILLFLLGCTAHMNHIEAHIESFHRIVPVNLAVPFFFTLRCLLQSSVCERRTGGVLQLQVWTELGQDVVSQSSGSASNSV